MREAIAVKPQQPKSSSDLGANALAAISGEMSSMSLSLISPLTSSTFPPFAAGGAVATMVTHPMDVAKTLMQTSLQVLVEMFPSPCDT